MTEEYASQTIHVKLSELRELAVNILDQVLEVKNRVSDVESKIEGLKQ